MNNGVDRIHTQKRNISFSHDMQVYRVQGNHR